MFDFVMNEHQRKLLDNLVRGTLQASSKCLVSDELNGTSLQGRLDDLGMKTICASIMIAPAKLYNLGHKKLDRIHRLLCENLSTRLDPAINISENVEIACKFIAVCMRKGFKGKIEPLSDQENMLKYLSRASFELFNDTVKKALFPDSEIPCEDHLVLSKSFVMYGVKVFALYCDTLRAWDDKGLKPDLDDDAEWNLSDAVSELERIARATPMKLMDWCRKHHEDGYVLEGKVGLFNVPAACRKWDGPYGIVITLVNQKIVYNVYFRDLISDIVRIKTSMDQSLALENQLIHKILSTSKSYGVDRELAEDVFNAGLVGSFKEALEYVSHVRDGDQAGLFEDIKKETRDDERSFEFDCLDESPPWEYQKGCHYEVDVEDHEITFEERCYLTKLQYLYKSRIEKIEGVYDCICEEVVYDEDTFNKIWFASLMVMALLNEAYRCYLEFQVYEPFASAVKRLDRDLYKIFDALFYLVRERLNEDDSEMNIFAVDKNDEREDMALHRIIEYLKNWLFRDEESENTKIVLEYFKDSIPSFIQKFQNEFAEV